MHASEQREGVVPSDAPEPTASPTLPEGFAFVRVLGEGGFGRVFVARQDSSAMPVALKIASVHQRGAIVALQRELRVLKAVAQPGVPRVIASGALENGDTWLAMSLLPGIPWPGSDSLDAEALLGRAKALLGKLALIHQAGFLHGDLKPENILVARDGSLSLIDFGLSFELHTCVPATEEVVGTVEYMSPEQCTPGASVDDRSDLYAVGILLYTALAGAPPFTGSAEEIREAHRSHRPTSLLPKGVPAALADLVMSALSKDPGTRPQGALLFRRALDDVLDGLRNYPLPPPAVSSSPHPVQPALSRETQRVALLWFVSHGALLGLRQVIREGGGHLILARGQAYAAAYTLSDCENPIRAAAATGTVLLGRGLVERALVDVVEAVVQSRPNGQPRISSRVLRGEGHHLADEDPAGLFATHDAACHVPDIERTPHPHLSSVFRLGKSIDPLDVTYLTESMLPLFGRDAELSRLLGHAHRAEHRVPRLATVLGDRGVGKTRLAREVVERLMTRSTDTRVVALKIPDPTYGSRENALRRLLSSIVSLPEQAPEDAALLLRAKLGVDVSPDVVLGIGMAMGWISSSDSAVVRLKAAPGALRSVLAKALGETLLVRARSQPLRLVIDDAQFLDDAALDGIEYATRAEVRAPLWICLFARHGFADTRAAWGAHASSHERCTLHPLAPENASSLIRSLLDQATNVSESVVTRLVERTKGFPLIIVELIRTLKRDGLLRRGERGSGWVIDTGALRHSPDVPLVQWLLDRELDALSSALRGHAGLLAVLGGNFTIDRASGLVRELERSGHAPPSELDPAVGIHRLRRAGLLIETAPHRFEFRSDLLREAAYLHLPPDVRKAMHLAAFRLYSVEPDLPDHERLPQLAFHATGAGLHEQAVDLELTLAGRAVDRHDYLLAHEAFQRALENLGDKDSRRLEAIHGLGLMRFRMGQHQDALRDLELACTWAREQERPDIEVEVLLDTATVLDWAEDYPMSRELVERAHEVCKAPISLLMQAKLLLGRGRSMFRLGDGPHATQFLRQAAEVAEKVGEEAYESRVIALLLAAPLAALGGDEAEGRSMFEQLLGLCHAHSDQLHLATTYLNRCVVWLAGGHIDELQADLRQAIAIARAAGFPLIEMRALFNLGEIAYMLGSYEDALLHTQESIDLVLQISGASQRVVVSRLLLARCHLVMGNLAEADAELARIRHLQMQRRQEGAFDLDYMPSDQALFHMVELSLREATEAEWDALIEQAAAASMQQELVEVLEFAGWAAQQAGCLHRAALLYERAASEADAHPTLLRMRVAKRRHELEN